MLPNSVRNQFFDVETDSWILGTDFMNELENDLQLLVDCVANSEAIVISGGIELNPTRTVTIERPIRITGDGSEGVAPVWTCGSSEESNQIANIR